MSALFLLDTHETNPYKNIATEAYLLGRIRPGDCILYLWQNRHTVVIGRNQNAYKECLVDALEADGGFLARRLSGGGAVYHDLGNLNFTFLAHADTYNLQKQHAVVLQALAGFGVQAEASGRNDLCIDGRKFSGNAFYKSGNARYHHGTLLVKVDMQNLSQYLNVPQDKLQAKGVASVRSRVVNLCDVCPAITTESLRPALASAFAAVYGAKVEILQPQMLDSVEIDRLQVDFAAPAWLYGQNRTADRVLSARFGWGGVDLHLHLQGNQIAACTVYTDAMDETLASVLGSAFAHCTFAKAEMTLRIAALPLPAQIRQDLAAMVAAEAF